MSQVIVPRPSTLARLADVEHLIRCHVDPEAAVIRCGWSNVSAAEQAARRHGSTALTRILSRTSTAIRRSRRPIRADDH